MLIKAKVFPGSKKEEIEKKDKDYFVIRVKEKAKKNMANKRVVEMLKEFFGQGVKQIKIIKGSRSPNKIIEIRMKDNG